MKNIATALLKVQQNIDPIHKGKKGYGYTYADLPSVLNVVVDALNSNGIVVVQSPEKTDKAAACIVTRLIHAESGEEITSTIEVPFEADNKQKMSVAQAYGSAITYAKRYALVSMLGVATEDDDGATAGRKKAEAAPIPQRKELTDAEKAEAAKEHARIHIDAAQGYDKVEYARQNAEVFSRIVKYPEAKAMLVEAGFNL